MKRLLLALLFAAPLAYAQTEAAATNEPQAQSQDEIDAYMGALNKPELPAAEEALQIFAMQYPDSQLRASGYAMLMQRAQQGNNRPKAVELGRKALGFDANNILALAVVAHLLAENSEGAADREARYAEALKDADSAIKNLEAGGYVPADTPEQREKVKNALLVTAYSAKGAVRFQQKDWAGTESELKAATTQSRLQADPVALMRLAIAQDNLKKYGEALASVNAAITAAEVLKRADLLGPARSHQKRLQALAGSPAPAKKAPTKK